MLFTEAWQKRFESMREFILEDEKRFSDELKRPKDSACQLSQPFGVSGTFTKLAID